jgi:hypothetical protein
VYSSLLAQCAGVGPGGVSRYNRRSMSAVLHTDIPCSSTSPPAQQCGDNSSQCLIHKHTYAQLHTHTAQHNMEQQQHTASSGFSQHNAYSNSNSTNAIQCITYLGLAAATSTYPIPHPYNRIPQTTLIWPSRSNSCMARILTPQVIIVCPLIWSLYA